MRPGCHHPNACLEAPAPSHLSTLSPAKACRQEVQARGGTSGSKFNNESVSTLRLPTLVDAVILLDISAQFVVSLVPHICSLFIMKTSPHFQCTT